MFAYGPSGGLACTDLLGKNAVEFSTSSPMITSIRYTLTSVGAAAISAFSSVSRAFAQDTGDLFGPTPNIGGVGTEEDIRQTVIRILGNVLEFMALVAVVFIIIAGIRLVISQGDEGQRDTAKKTIIYVIVGLIIILIARAIVEFVSNEIAP